MTTELADLYQRYKAKWACDPDFYEETEYSYEDYDEYVADIEKALELGVELPCIYSDEEDDEEYYDDNDDSPVNQEMLNYFYEIGRAHV